MQLQEVFDSERLSSMLPPENFTMTLTFDLKI